MIDEHSATQSNTADLMRPVATEAPAVIDDRYVLERRLGGGGMGTVYRARDKLMERHHDRDPYVALKLINDSLRDNAEVRTLLQRECSRAQKLSHPNIIRVFYFGCDEKTDADFLTMELLRGEPLEHLIRDHPSGLPWHRSSRLIEQLCSGLAYAHAEGIVHSDIKPSNLFMTDASILKILDFGIAAPLRSAETGREETLINARRSGAVSDRYSSLEMHLGLDADPSDDVYSAACVIYELLTGRHPYRKLKTPQAAHENIKPAPVKCLNKAQNRALMRALNFRRSERTAAIEELKAGLLAAPPTIPKISIGFAVAALVTVIVAIGAAALLRSGPKPTAGTPVPSAASNVTPSPSSGPAGRISSTPKLHRMSAAAPLRESLESQSENAALPSQNAAAPPHDSAVAPPRELTAAQSTLPQVTVPLTPPPAVEKSAQPPAEKSAPPAAEKSAPPVAEKSAPPAAEKSAPPATEKNTASGAESKPPISRVAQNGPATPAAKARVAQKKLDRRCASIDERIQLGETISEQERSIYAQRCQ
jgi:serine/threonine protein kinase